MLLSPGLAALNTLKVTFWLTSILHSAEAGGQEAWWADWFISRVQAEAGPPEGRAWPSRAVVPGMPATDLAHPPLHFKHSLRLGANLLPSQRALWEHRD